MFSDIRNNTDLLEDSLLIKVVLREGRVWSIHGIVLTGNVEALGGEGGDLSTKILIGTRSKPGLRSESLGVAGRLQKSTVCED